MTVQECYQQIQGNYENVLKRLKTDERIVKFLELFLSDTTEGQFIFSNRLYHILYCNFKCELGIVFQRRTDTWLYRAAQRSDTDSDGD